MLVGDIYGDRDYSSIGLSATTIASSFGKVVSQVRPAGILHAAAMMHSHRPASLSGAPAPPTREFHTQGLFSARCRWYL